MSKLLLNGGCSCQKGDKTKGDLGGQGVGKVWMGGQATLKGLFFGANRIHGFKKSTIVQYYLCC